MATNNNTLGFKRGLQESLNNLILNGNADEGIFYLTSDTNRLYIGKKDTDNKVYPFPVNQGVITVNTIEDLPATAEKLKKVVAGQFYYVSSNNLLCVYNGNQWVQINPDTDTDTKTDITSVTLSKSSANTGITIDGQLAWKKTDIDGKIITDTTTDFTETIITSDDFAKVLKADLTTASITNSGAKVSLDTTGISKTQDNSINIIGDDVDTKVIAESNNNIKISTNTIKSIDVKTSEDKSKIELTTTKQNNTGPSVDFTSALKDHLATYIYTETEVDSKIQGLKDELRQLDAMVYRGTLGDGGTVTALPTDNVKVGDTYKVITSGTYNGQSSKVGDLFIALGTEDSTTGIITSGLTWTYIPSGDSTDSQFIFNGDGTNKTISLKNKTLNNNAGSFKIEGGKQIDTSLEITTDNDTNGDNATFTIAHASITTTPTDSGEVRITNETKQDIISGITVDNGHITGYTTKTINTNDYTFSGTETRTSDSTSNSVKTTLALSSSDNAKRGEYNSTLTSTSLDLQHSGDATSGYTTAINLVWGSF